MILKNEADSSYLSGKLLLAMPGMGDERFSGSVIHVCVHSEAGAMGVIINRPITGIDISDLLNQLDVTKDREERNLDHMADRLAILQGGPVESKRGFILHSSDFSCNHTTQPITDGISLTATLDILKAMVEGTGPRKALLILGYAGWAAGQLEKEIQANVWLHCPATSELVFDTAASKKYAQALKEIGVDLLNLSRESGHA
jgi:putative transcriptional regulator